jgi:hypothetical protein
LTTRTVTKQPRDLLHRAKWCHFIPCQDDEQAVQETK